MTPALLYTIWTYFKNSVENRPHKEAIISFVTGKAVWSLLPNKSYSFIIMFHTSVTYVP